MTCLDATRLFIKLVKARHFLCTRKESEFIKRLLTPERLESLPDPQNKVRVYVEYRLLFKHLNMRSSVSQVKFTEFIVLPYYSLE
jgi:hypothetical protein